MVCRDTGRKVEDPELLEAIRLTVINNLLEYHPVFIVWSISFSRDNICYNPVAGISSF